MRLSFKRDLRGVKGEVGSTTPFNHQAALNHSINSFPVQIFSKAKSGAAPPVPCLPRGRGSASNVSPTLLWAPCPAQGIPLSVSGMKGIEGWMALALPFLSLLVCRVTRDTGDGGVHRSAVPLQLLFFSVTLGSGLSLRPYWEIDIGVRTCEIPWQ